MCKINTYVVRTFSDHEACGIVDINTHVGSLMTVSCLVNILCYKSMYNVFAEIMQYCGRLYRFFFLKNDKLCIFWLCNAWSYLDAYFHWQQNWACEHTINEDSSSLNVFIMQLVWILKTVLPLCIVSPSHLWTDNNICVLLRSQKADKNAQIHVYSSFCITWHIQVQFHTEDHPCMEPSSSIYCSGPDLVSFKQVLSTLSF